MSKVKSQIDNNAATSGVSLLTFRLYKKFLRLSSERDLYTVGQAAFRLNISRNEFISEFVNTGKVNVLFRNGRQFVTAQSIKQYIAENQLVHKIKLTA